MCQFQMQMADRLQGWRKSHIISFRHTFLCTDVIIEPGLNYNNLKCNWAAMAMIGVM